MEQEPIYSTSVNAGDDGAWLQDIRHDITPGVHRVVVEDEHGNQDEAMLFVVKEEPVVLAQVTKIVPLPFFYGISALFLIVLVLAAWNVWLGRLADRQLKGGRRTVKRYLPLAITVAVVAMLASLAVGIVLNRQTAFVELAKEGLTGVVKPKIDISGSVQTPFEHQGVPGLDLTVGDTSVRTVQGGRYVFSQIEQGSGIRINHQALKVSFVVSADRPGVLDIPFDSDLYNAIFDIQQLEARGKYGDIFDKMPDSARQAIGRDEFVGGYAPVFGPADIRSQVIDITVIKELNDWKSVNGMYGFPQVIQVELRNNPQAKTYEFVKENGAWKLIK